MIKRLLLVGTLALFAAGARAQVSSVGRNADLRIQNSSASKACPVIPTDPAVNQAMARYHHRRNQLFKKPAAFIKTWVKSNRATLSIWATTLPVQRWTR